MRLRTRQVSESARCLSVRLLMLCPIVDAQFEVLGAPYSLLSVSLSASQKLYTRRGTLVGVSGKTENVSMVDLFAKVITNKLTGPINPIDS